MELDIDKTSGINIYMIPHIALTTYKYRGKGAAVFKKAKADITVDQFIILKLLTIFEKLTQQETAEILFKDKSNLSRMLDVLENKKYINRILDIKDNRAVKILSITKKGSELVEKINEIVLKLHNRAMDGISKEEQEIVKNVMKKIRNNLDKEFEVAEL